MGLITKKTPGIREIHTQTTPSLAKLKPGKISIPIEFIGTPKDVPNDESRDEPKDEPKVRFRKSVDERVLEDFTKNKSPIRVLSASDHEESFTEKFILNI